MVMPVTSQMCQRCGECCRFMVVPLKGIPDDVIQWAILTKDATRSGSFLLIEHPCRFLAWDQDHKVATCLIHEKPEYPAICRQFDGTSRGRFYVPPGCRMRHPNHF